MLQFETNSNENHNNSMESVKKETLTVTVKRGQRICCPLPEHTSWNQHPRVYIDLEDTDEATCPYCGTHFKVK